MYRKIYTKLFSCRYLVSYAQNGEDIIIANIFNWLGVTSPTYLDIGAHHPTLFSNTHFFYERGCSGVCIEPDPQLCKTIQKHRRRDIVINAGIGDASPAENFYVMSTPTLNTFSKKEAEKYSSDGSHSIVKVLKVPLLNVNQILEQNFSNTPDFVSIDVEGLEMKILQSIDFNRFKPTVFCIETLTYDAPGKEKKILSLVEFMQKNNYICFADTYINTIFVATDAWQNRRIC